MESLSNKCLSCWRLMNAWINDTVAIIFWLLRGFLAFPSSKVDPSLFHFNMAKWWSTTLISSSWPTNQTLKFASGTCYMFPYCLHYSRNYHGNNLSCYISEDHSFRLELPLHTQTHTHIDIIWILLGLCFCNTRTCCFTFGKLGFLASKVNEYARVPMSV